MSYPLQQGEQQQVEERAFPYLSHKFHSPPGAPDIPADDLTRRRPPGPACLSGHL